MVSLSTVESEPSLAGAERKIGRAWEQVSGMINAQVSSWRRSIILFFTVVLIRSRRQTKISFLAIPWAIKPSMLAQPRIRFCKELRSLRTLSQPAKPRSRSVEIWNASRAVRTSTLPKLTTLSARCKRYVSIHRYRAFAS